MLNVVVIFLMQLILHPVGSTGLQSINCQHCTLCCWTERMNISSRQQSLSMYRQWRKWHLLTCTEITVVRMSRWPGQCLRNLQCWALHEDNW